MRLQPKDASRGRRFNAGLLPPRGFIPAAMDLAMMTPTEGHSELVTDLAAQYRRLGKSQMVRIGWPTTADQARLLGN
jgi:hypothetical protein